MRQRRGPSLHMPEFVTHNEQRLHVHTVRVRYADTDRMDMVYHGTYAAYLEAARVEMLRAIGWVYADMEAEGVLLPVVHLSMDYHHPARYDQLLEVRTHVAEPPTSKLTLACEVHAEGVRLVSARVVLVFLDDASRRPCRPPRGLSDALREAGLVAPSTPSEGR